uniref:Alpha 1,4-glycosyltransferase domain-containing protein n=2 Tax=Ditylum brightwellii TaxID=49249 RepID=A0A7S4SK37_9STRA|mmetsp:Transcript_21558/g.28669  ORF Transcript_21558/g.28669 Transcript_21558/m.28669 type:complete len:331 (-) Transcript_21558:171-1163(-)
MKISHVLWVELMIGMSFAHSSQTKPQHEEGRSGSKMIRRRTTGHKLSILPTIIGEISGPLDHLPPSCDNAAKGEEIPKRIIQTVATKDTLNDSDWFKFHTSLQEQNLNYTFHIFDDNESLQFIDEHFNNTTLPDVIRSVPRPVMKADLFRLAAVSVLGGFYMDMDMLAKGSFDPIVYSGCGAVFPKEWWRDDDAFFDRHFKLPLDSEDHWQVGNYAFAAVPKHPLLIDSLEEAIKRSAELIHSKGEKVDDVTDLDVLRTTGPYMLSEVYHDGRKEGKYKDVLHISGDKSRPLKKGQEHRFSWHKFGPYAEHMLSHTWVQAEEEMKSDTEL